MLGRRKATDDSTATLTPEGPGKNRPTPRRREAVAARRQPLVPTSRSAAGKGKGGKGGGRGGGKEVREAARLERMKARQLMMSGDERYLAARDKGPVRRLARDVVDSRWNLGELLLPVMVLVLVLSFVGGSMQQRNPQIYSAIFAITYGMVLLSAIDAFLMTRRLKRQVAERFGSEAWVRGTSMYAVMRAFQIRRTRVPKPQVQRGQPPA